MASYRKQRDRIARVAQVHGDEQGQAMYDAMAKRLVRSEERKFSPSRFIANHGSGKAEREQILDSIARNGVDPQELRKLAGDISKDELKDYMAVRRRRIIADNPNTPEDILIAWARNTGQEYERAFRAARTLSRKYPQSAQYSALMKENLRVALIKNAMRHIVEEEAEAHHQAEEEEHVTQEAPVDEHLNEAAEPIPQPPAQSGGVI